MNDEPIAAVAAPFPVPAFVRPTFPARAFDIKAFGAVGDGQTKNTAAFTRAIETASLAGGGTVLVPEGRWLTGPIHLRSNIRLHVVKGAELLFSQDFADYLPPVFTRWEGLEVYNYSPLIYARDCENVAVTGEGTLNGQGQAWWPWKKTQQATAARLYELATSGVPPEQRVLAVEGGLRPSFIQTVGCRNVLVEGVTIRNGPMWTIHPVYSENVIVRRVQVRTEGPNNDGCNPDSSKNVLIEDSFFSTGDDCVVIKSGLNEDGWRVGKPSENIIVRRIHGEIGHGGVVIGSEMSGSVRNVWVSDSEFIGTDRGLRIKSMRGRGGVVENVYYENVRHKDIAMMVVEMTTAYASSTLVPKTDKPPLFRNIFVRNLTATGAKAAAEISGLSDVPVENLVFEQVQITSETGFHCAECKGLRLADTHVTPSTGVPFLLVNTRQATLTGSCSAPVASCIKLEGERSEEAQNDGVKVAVQAAAKPAAAKSVKKK
jgi:polygalacturonase